MPLKIYKFKKRHVLADKSLRLPISVLLALPERPDRQPVDGIFNLPAAINLLLGGPGWRRAVRVLNPSVLAPEWTNEGLLTVLREARLPPTREAIASTELMGLRRHSADGPFVIRHFAAGRGTDAHWRPTPAKSPLLPWSRPQPPMMVCQRTKAAALDTQTRLLILQTHYPALAEARGFAEDTINKGGPVVLVVAGEDFAAANAYLTDVYAGVVHNKMLSVTAAFQKPYAIEAELWLGEGGDQLLSFDSWVRELESNVSRVDSTWRAFRGLAREQLRQLEPYYHRATLAKQTRGTEQKIDAAKARVADLQVKLNFQRESEGVYPLLDLADSLPDVERRVGKLEDEVKDLEHRLHEGAQRGPRVLNANFADPCSGKFLGPREPLLAGAAYNFLVDIGPRWSKAPTLVRGAAEFPEKAMPAKGDGFPVRVVLISEAFEPKMSSAWIWVPRFCGRSMPYSAAEVAHDNAAPAARPKEGKTGPAVIPVVVPAVTDGNDNEPNFVSGRLCLYYEGNLIQSARLKIGIGTSSDVKLPDKNEIRVDYALTNTIADVQERCSGRVLAFTDGTEAVRHPVSVNIALNNDALGDHRIILAGHPGKQLPLPGWAQYNPKAAEEVLKAARTELLNCFFLRTPAGDVDVERTALDRNNAKPFEQFLADLMHLCEVGAELYSMVTSQIRVQGHAALPLEWARSLRAALARASVIQVARTVRAEYAIPWSIMYDIPMAGPKFEFCKVVREWENGERPSRMLDRCPYADDPGHRQNVYCPYGLWGLKHVVEQPLNQLAKKENGDWEPIDVAREFARSTAIDVALAVTRDAELDLPRIDRHLAELQAIRRVKLCPPSPAADTDAACRAMADTDMVYFLCHGDVDPTPPLKRPFLGIGARDGDATHMIYVRTVEGWAQTDVIPNLAQWGERRPFVFINGCHTTNLSPEQILNFVTGFGNARASGVLGTEVSIKVPVAIEAAKIFLEKLLTGMPAGQALREMRWTLANKGNLLGLAYTLYAMADLRTQTAVAQPVA